MHRLSLSLSDLRKTHKPNIPMSPVNSGIGSAPQKLAIANILAFLFRNNRPITL